MIERGISDGLHLGGQGYVWREGAVVADWAFGEVRAGVAMGRETILPWLSSGKPITAVAIAQLWEKGLLDLDDAVVKFIPEFAANYKEGVTLRHLLTHTAGLRWVDTGYPRASWKQVIAKIAGMRMEPRWEPGQKAGYHAATSWFILGEIIRRVDGRDFERYVAEEVFAPLGMTSARFAVGEQEYRDDGQRIGIVYNTEDPERAAPPPASFETPQHAAAVSPGSSARGSARELGRFYQMLLNRGSAISDRESEISESKAPALLRPQTVEALTARHRTGLFDHTFKHTIDWGLGFVLNSAMYGEVPYGYGPHASQRTFGHSGAQSSVAFADPEHGLVVALVFNGMPGEERHQQRMRSALAGVYEDLGLGSEGTLSGGSESSV